MSGRIKVRMIVGGDVLTREQYRALLPDGERHWALEALKPLMLTRPIVYLGFGLLDPNFISLKNLLSNTFKGGARDHYAILADTSEEEERFWLRAARIDSFRGHLLGRIATDAFVAQRLLPLVSSEPGLFQDNLRAVIRDAGRRHGQRYLPG